MPHFAKITNKLYQGSWPESLQQGVNFDLVLNVSDHPCSSINCESPAFYKKPCHIWLPINEWSVWSYEIFYAAKKILDANQDKVCLIHCEAGVCRSAIILYAWLWSNGNENILSDPWYQDAWQRFLNPHSQASNKAPPYLEQFLLTMNKYPQCSACGVLGYMLQSNRFKNTEEGERIVDFLRGRGIF